MTNDWRLTLPLVLLAVGAVPASASSVPDTCRRIPAATVRALLFDAAGGTLDSWSSMNGNGDLGCTWEARPQGSPDTRHMTLTIHDHSDAATARKAIAGVSRDSGADGAASGGSDDDLAHSDTFVAVARHGAIVATLDATGAGLNEDQGRYWLDAGVLAAAGSTMRPKAPASLMQEPGDTDVPDWTPPAHDGGTIGWLLAPLVAALGWLASWRFPMIAAGVVGAVAIGATSRGKQLSRARAALAVGLIAFVICNVTFGTDVAAALTYHLGEDRRAMGTPVAG